VGKSASCVQIVFLASQSPVMHLSGTDLLNTDEFETVGSAYSRSATVAHQSPTKGSFVLDLCQEISSRLEVHHPLSGPEHVPIPDGVDRDQNPGVCWDDCDLPPLQQPR